jgi:outer membrane protein insertion porin family
VIQSFYRFLKNTSFPIRRWWFLSLFLFNALGQEPPPPVTVEPVAPEPPPPEQVPAAPVTFIGNQAFKEDELRSVLAEHLAAIEHQGLTRARADDLAFFTELHYRRHGYSRADVRYEIERGARLILRIDEGPLTKLGDIKIRGNTSISEATLREYMIGATRERFSRFKGDLPFIEADMRTGVSRIRAVYLSQGHLNVRVTGPEVDYSPDQSVADVTVTIDEGKSYKFGQVQFRGTPLFPREQLMAELGDLLDEPYTKEQAVTAENKLEYFYETQGYFKAEVTVVSDPDAVSGTHVPVVFTIEPGPLYRFNGVTVTGTRRLHPGFLERRFSKLRGEIYDPRKQEEIFRGMIETGLFRNLRIQSEPIEGNQVRLNLDVEEAKTKEIGFLIGFGTWEGGFVGLRLGERNLFGTGRSLIGSGEFSGRGYRGEILYEDPWFLESDFKLRLRVYALSRDLEQYDKFEIGFRPELSRKLTKNYEIALFAQPRYVKITEPLVVPEEVGPEDYFVNAVGITQSFDTRDNPLNPRAGFVISTSLDAATAAIGSDIEFVRASYRFSYYRPMWKLLLALGARGGVIHPIGADKLPIDERFFNGGATTVRSFTERDMAPKDRRGYSIGGEAWSVYNVELIFPIVGDLKGAVFVDAGNLHSDAADFGFSDMRYAIGAGLRYDLPVGPLRLDYGLNPSPKEGESSGAFHFSFGFAF